MGPIRQDPLVNLSKTAQDPLDMLSELGSAVENARDSQQMLTDVCRILTTPGWYDLAWIGLIRPDAPGVLPLARAGLEDVLPDPATLPIGDPDGASRQLASLAQQAQPVVMTDIQDDGHIDPWLERPFAAGCRSAAALPIRRDGEVIGLLNLYSRLPDAFGRDCLPVLQRVADHVASGLSRLQTTKPRLPRPVDPDAERQRLQLLYNITQAVTSSLEPAEILQRAISLTSQNLGALFGEAFTLDRLSNLLHLQALSDPDPARIASVRDRLGAIPGGGIPGWIVANRQALNLAEVSADPRWEPFSQAESQAHAVLGAPILAGDELLGVLLVFHHQPAAFRDEHLELLTTIARQVGLALANAERYQQAQRRLAELAALQQVGQVINRRLEMQPLLEEVVRQVAEVLGYPMVEILLVEGQDMVFRAGRGPDLHGVRTAVSEGVSGRVARTNMPAFVPDVRVDPDYLALVPTTETEIAVPLRKGGVVFGVLNVESPKPGSLTEGDMRLLSLLGDQISVAIENAALYDHVRQHADALERTVADRTAALEEALDHARQADRIKSRFVSDVSHELRTPLSNIRLYLDLLTLGKPERFPSYLETLDRETNRLARLIEDLLAISRLDAGAAMFQPSEFDLNSLASVLVEDRRRLFAQKGLKLEFSPQPDLPAIFADERMVTQVVANLLTNAMQYTLSGSVTVSTASQTEGGRSWVTVTLADTGLGILAEDLPYLFERFFRGASSRLVRAPGTGLGLAICKEILDRHGGRVTVESEEGRGSAFTIWLPVNKAGSVAAIDRPAPHGRRTPGAR